MNTVDERHRHRYEVNPIYIEAFEEAGMKFVGRSEDNQRMEIVELESKFREILFDQIIFFFFFFKIILILSVFNIIPNIFHVH